MANAPNSQGRTAPVGGPTSAADARRIVELAAAAGPVRVDLGCGLSKRDGFVGIDRFPMPKVDIVCDIDQGLPLADDSVDYLVASHSLEHFESLPSVMSEIYRICKDRALVTIIAPYNDTRLNQANPYHLQRINEHTPRFLTSADTASVPQAEYSFPFAEAWGLGTSDNGDWTEDFRLLHMEFFYMPAYRGLDDGTKRDLRKAMSDICDQVAMQLLVVKSPITEQELRERASQQVWPTTPDHEARRAEEAKVGAENAVTRMLAAADVAQEVSARLDHQVQAVEAQRALSELMQDRLNALGEDLRGLALRVAEAAAEGERATGTVSADSARVAELGESVRQIEATVTEAALQVRRLGALSEHVTEATIQATDAKLTTTRLAGQVADLEHRLGDRDSVQRLQQEIDALATAREADGDDFRRLEVSLVQIDQRLREVEAASAAPTPEPGIPESIDVRLDELADRIMAINTAFTRRAVELEENQRRVLTPEGTGSGSGPGHRAVSRLVEQQALLQGSVDHQAAYVQAALTHLVAARIASERAAPKILTLLRAFRHRGRDLRAQLAQSPFAAWLNTPYNASSKQTRIQLGDYWRAGDGAAFEMGPTPAGLCGFDLAAWTFMPPAAPLEILAFEIAAPSGQILAYGGCAAAMSVEGALELRFAPLETAQPGVTLRISGLPNIERVGLKLYEHRRIQPLSRRLVGRKPLAAAILG